MTMKMTIRMSADNVVTAGLTLMALATLFAMSAAATAAAPEPPPIKIGAISTLSGGPADFSSSGLAAKAFFDGVNAAGGIQKRKLVFVHEDDKGNPGAAAEAAGRLINETRVVAMAGGASLLECAVNADTYLEAGLASIPGLGLDRRCFSSPMIAPVNAGPYTQLVLAMRYASERLQAKKLCIMRLGSPINVQKAFDGVIQDWTEKTGLKPVLDERDIQYADAPESYFKNAIDAGCQAIVFGGSGPFALRFARAGKKMLPANVSMLFLGSAYTSQFAETLGADGDGIYAMSEFEPWSSRSGSLSNWRNLLTANKVPLTSASQGGYVAAQVLVGVLRSIKGDINRESVTLALQKLRPYDVAMLGMPYSFGPDKTHHPNRAALPMRLSGGSWRIAHHEWIKLAEPAVVTVKP